MSKRLHIAGRFNNEFVNELSKLFGPKVNQGSGFVEFSVSSNLTKDSITRMIGGIDLEHGYLDVKTREE